MSRRSGALAALVTVAASLVATAIPAAARAGCEETYRQAARLPGGARALWLLYHPGPRGQEAEVVSTLSALAEHFRPADLRVGVAGGPAGSPVGWTAAAEAAGAHALAAGQGCEPDRIEVRGPAGDLLFEGEVGDGDLYQAQLAIHRHLHPDSACTYLGQVERLLREHEATLPPGRGEILFLPPGCSACTLQKHAARIGELLRERPDVAVAAFSADVGEPLARLGWRGGAIVLPPTAGATVLGLRRHGVYLPVVARRTGPGRFALRTISGPEVVPAAASGPAAPASALAPAPAAAPRPQAPAASPVPPPVPEHRLEPVAVIEGGEYMGEPIDIEHEASSIYVLDAVEKVVWIIDERSGGARELAGRGEARFREPLDLFFGCGGRLYVTDLRASAIHELDRAGGRWRSIAMGHRPFYGAAGDGFLVTNSRRDEGPHLADRLGCGEAAFGHLGARLVTGQEHASADMNANYTIFATDGERVAVGHIGLGLVELFTAAGAPRGRFVIDTPEARDLRSWYLEGAEAPLREPLTLERTLADLAAKAQPGTFPVPVYLADLQFHAGRLLALCNGVVNAYDLQGTLLARYVAGGTHEGEKVLIHDFTVTADGRLLGLDAAHYRKVYDFGPLPGG